MSFGSFHSQVCTRPDRRLKRRFIKSQDFADFARRGAPAIGNDVGRHRGAQFPVALINILNRAFALIAAGQIEIDVRPFATLFGKKPLE